MLIHIDDERGDGGAAGGAIENRQRQGDGPLDVLGREEIEQCLLARMMAKEGGVMDARLGRDFADGDLIERLALDQRQQGALQRTARFNRAGVAQG